MSKKGRRKTNQPHQNIKSAQRRYKFWIIGVVLVVTLIAIGIIAIQAGGNRSTPATTATINPSDIPRISAEAVKAKLDTGVNLVIIDARSEAEYEQTRIAGAIFIPPGQIAQRYEELNAYDEVVTYCTWPQEETSARVAQILLEAGVSNVKPIKGGLQAWIEAGYPIEGTDESRS